MSTTLLRPVLGVSLVATALSAGTVAAAGPANAQTACNSTHRLDCKDPEVTGSASGGVDYAGDAEYEVVLQSSECGE